MEVAEGEGPRWSVWRAYACSTVSASSQGIADEGRGITCARCQVEHVHCKSEWRLHWNGSIFTRRSGDYPEGFPRNVPGCAGAVPTRIRMRLRQRGIFTSSRSDAPLKRERLHYMETGLS